jgi:hypothetical protein
MFAKSHITCLLPNGISARNYDNYWRIGFKYQVNQVMIVLVNVAFWIQHKYFGIDSQDLTVYCAL